MIQLNSKTTLAERNDKILDAVKNGDYNVGWATIHSIVGDDTASFNVFDDALKIDIEYTDANGIVTNYSNIRINVSASLQQKIADILNCSLLTTKLADLIFDQALCKIGPKPRPISSDTIVMIQHSIDVDVEIARKNCTTCLTSTVGKHWVLDNKALQYPGMATNYGWNFSGGSKYQGVQGYPNCTLLKDPTTNQPYYVIQPNACAHNSGKDGIGGHTDYSQTCSLVSRECIVNGETKDILDIFQDPKLSYLANNGGILKVLRSI